MGLGIGGSGGGGGGVLDSGGDSVRISVAISVGRDVYDWLLTQGDIDDFLERLVEDAYLIYGEYCDGVRWWLYGAVGGGDEAEDGGEDWWDVGYSRN